MIVLEIILIVICSCLAVLLVGGLLLIGIILVDILLDGRVTTWAQSKWDEKIK